MIIALTGMPGSGKTILAEMLQKKGFKIFEMSKVLNDMMTERGIEMTTKNREEFSTNLRKRRGPDVYAKETAKRIKYKKGSKVVISGLRSPAEIVYFRKKFKDKFTIVATLTPAKIRFERLRHRKEHAIESYNDFKFRDSKMKEFGMLKVIGQADYVISNTSSFDKLHKEVDDVLRDIRKRAKA